MTKTKTKRVAPGDPLTVVAYIRRSREKQALSPEAQRRAIEHWCAEHGAKLVAVHVEEAMCRDTDLDERPAFSAALEGIAANRAGVLLVAKRDRLGCGLLLMLTAEKRLTERGARLLSAADEGSEDEDPLRRYFNDIFAERELWKIRERTCAGLAAKRARGEKTGGEAPYGFCREMGTTPKGEPVAILVPVPSETAVIERVRALRAEKLSYARIARQLMADGVKPRSGDRWHETQVRRMLAAVAA